MNLNLNTINDLYEYWKSQGKDTIQRLYSYIIQNSMVFEDIVEDIVKEAYKNKIRPTQITKQYCKPLYDKLDYEYLIQHLSEKENFHYSIDFVNDFKKHIQSDEFFTYIYGYINDFYRIIIQESNTIEDADINNVEELIDLRDKVNDVLTVGKQFSIDEPIRDYCFIIYNNTWLNYNNELNLHSHNAIVDAVFGENSAQSINIRDIENIKDADPSAPVIFGDAINNICFIEGYQNLSLDEAAKICRQRFKKVYRYIQTENTVQRLASKNNKEFFI